MRVPVVRLLLSLLVLQAEFVLAQQPAYTFHTLDLPDALGLFGNVSATDIQEDNRLTLQYSWSPGDPVQPGTFHTYGTAQNQAIACPAPAVWTGIQGTNHGRALTGWCYTDGATPTVTGFYRAANGVWTTLVVPGAIYTEGRDVNNWENVVGTWIDSGGNCHGFVWAQSTGQYTTLDVPAAWNGVCTNPQAIENANVIVGTYQSPLGHQRGFRYDLNANTWGAVAGPDNDVTVLTGINDYGVTLVYSDNVMTGSHGYYLWQNGVFTPFVFPFPQADWYALRRINNAGWIVGDYTETIYPPGWPDTTASPTYFNRAFVAIPRPAAPAVASIKTPRGRQKQALSIESTEVEPEARDTQGMAHTALRVAAVPAMPPVSPLCTVLQGPARQALCR
jgi:hypothetical protein